MISRELIARSNDNEVTFGEQVQGGGRREGNKKGYDVEIWTIE